jgi:short-subunit dehydrogenase
MNPVVKRKDMDRPETVVHQALRAFEREKRVVVPGKVAVRIMAATVRFFPRAIVAKMAESSTRKLNQYK